MLSNRHRMISESTGNSAATVLVVDDMATNRMLVKQALKGPEFDVIEAESGVKALELLPEQPLDLVFLDVMMPEMDGFQVCEAIRKDPNYSLLPIIMLTSLGDSDDVVHGMAAGADDFLNKPFIDEELLARARAAVDRKRLTDRLDDTESVLFSLARMVEARDAGTGGHCDRLMHTGVLFGKALDLPYEDLDALRKGGVLHDIGKLGIPDSVLLKPGKLSQEEWQVMKQHTTIGAALCSPLASMRRTVKIVRHHHEHWNGSGYPDGLKGKDIPLLARVFQIVDAFDALGSARPYKPALPVERVIRIMKDEAKRGLWDPDLISIFLDMVETTPGDLHLPVAQPPDRSAVIVEQVVSSGVMAWYQH